MMAYALWWARITAEAATYVVADATEAIASGFKRGWALEHARHERLHNDPR